jgi:hypothetical protein
MWLLIDTIIHLLNIQCCGKKTKCKQYLHLKFKYVILLSPFVITCCECWKNNIHIFKPTSYPTSRNALPLAINALPCYEDGYICQT